MLIRRRLARLDASQWNLPGPVLIILGPVVGLLYILVLPLIGFIALIFLALSHVKEVLPTAWRKRFRISVKA
ncbi:MAG: hypothetical protein Q7R57_04920 [Dehalococcoidales bacterium]|nr:hypothetical protein [Dehalococcoidales bacterium]